MQLQARLPGFPLATGPTMSEKTLGATLFAIKGLPEKPFRLRVLKVRGHVPQDSQTPVRMNRWATALWKRDLKQAVVPTNRFGWPGFLTPDSERCTAGQLFSIEEDVPDARYSVETTDQVMEVDVKNAPKEELYVASEMLKRVISDGFAGHKNHFWRKHWNLYFRIVPENNDTKTDAVYAYRGMRFAVVFLAGAPWLAADIVTTYRGIKPLTEYSALERENNLYYHLSSNIEVEDRAYFLRDNKSSKIPCRFVSDSGKTISEISFQIENQRKTLLEYYRERYGILLDENDPAIYVQDRGGTEQWPVPASRLFPIFKTENDEVSSCSVVPFLSPTERVKLISDFLTDIGSREFSGSKLTVDKTPFETGRSYFAAPDLEFREESILRLDQKLPIETAFANYRRGKLDALYKYGTFSEQSLTDLAFIYPSTLPRQVRETFQKQISQEIKEISGVTPKISRQIEYRLGNQPSSGAGLLRAVDDLLPDLEKPLLPFVVLAEQFGDRVYELLKRRFRSAPSQCVSERTVKKLARDTQAAGGSRLRNLALAILTAGGIQPWVLAKPLNYDFYMGVDLLFNQVIYVFVCGKGGRYVWVRRGTPRKRHFLTEKIDEFELADRFEEGIREAKELGVDIKSVVVHRDGRWWSNEDQALTNAIDALQSDNVLPADVQVGVVEIHKSHLPARLFTISRNGNERLENPVPGSHLVLNDSEILLTSTGQPGQWDRQHRTASTLLLRIVRDDKANQIDIEKIASDAYGLTHLNWNAPEIEISMPVTIRWSDERLREMVLNSQPDVIEAEEQEVA